MLEDLVGEPAIGEGAGQLHRAHHHRERRKGLTAWADSGSSSANRAAISSTMARAPPVSAGRVSFAYRELGPKTGVPVVFLTHLAAVLDNYDARVVDGIAAQHRGDHVRQPRCRCLDW